MTYNILSFNWLLLMRKSYNYEVVLIFFSYSVRNSLDPDWDFWLDLEPDSIEYGSETLLSTTIILMGTKRVLKQLWWPIIPVEWLARWCRPVCRSRAACRSHAWAASPAGRSPAQCPRRWWRTLAYYTPPVHHQDLWGRNKYDIQTTSRPV